MQTRFLAGLILAAAASAASAEVTVKDAWVRGVVSGQKVTGAFMTVTSTEDAKIVGASSQIAKRAEIHTSMVMGGVNHMRKVDAIPLPAGKPVELKSGSYHVMLMEISQPMRPGDTVSLALTVVGKDGKPTEIPLKAKVRPVNAR